MELGVFLNSTVVKGATTEVVRERPNPADRGLYGAALLPEVYKDTDRFERKVTMLGRAMIANDVAPLSRGRMKGAIRRSQVGGGLIDSAAHLHLDGEDIEAFLALVRELQGDTVRATMPEVQRYMQLVDRFLLEPLDQNRERKRWTLMGTGKAYYENSRQDDFTRPPVLNVFDASQITVVTGADSIYGGADADFIADVDARIQAAQDLGYEIREIVMTSGTQRQILGLSSTRQALGMTSLDVSTGGGLTVNMQSGLATSTALNAFLASTNRPTIRVYDGRWFDQVQAEDDPEGVYGTTVSRTYVPHGRLIFVPQGDGMDMNLEDPTVPFKVEVFNPNNSVGLHVIGRPTAQTQGARVYVFGPYYHEGVHPNMDGDSVVAHMPFLTSPAGFQVVEYAGAPE
jgi:hypothetical protein